MKWNDGCQASPKSPNTGSGYIAFAADYHQRDNWKEYSFIPLMIREAVIHDKN
jgi:hypothetical protein